MTDSVGHFEIPADNSDRARKFYADTFGWKMNVMEGMDYTMVSTGPVNEQGIPQEPGFIGGGIGPRSEMLEHPVVTIIVDDIDDAMKRVEEHGGTVIQEKKAVGDGTMGWTAYFKDSENNTVGLYQWPKQ